MNTIHATCVAFGKTGVLIRGPSGSGKSSLALRLIDGEGYGLGNKKLRAKLVGDDQVLLKRSGQRLSASPASSLVGLIELRGVGIVKTQYQRSVHIALVVDLMPASAITRLPEKDDAVEIEGVSIARIHLDAGTAQASAVLRAALSRVRQKRRA